MIHVLRRVTCHHLFLTGSREYREVLCAAVSPDLTILCGPEKGVSELSNDTKHDVVSKNIAYKSELRGSISIQDSPPFPVLTMLASKRNVHHFLLIKAEKKARFVRDDPASKTRVDICKRTKTCAAQEF